MGSRLLQSNFSSGEASERLLASGDLDRYQFALSRAVNTIILPLGAAEKRSGTIWVGDPKDATQTARILPFVRTVDDAVAIIVQDETLRFFDVAASAPLLDEDDDPIEVACPWGVADYSYLRTFQSADVLWIYDARGAAPVRVLKRVGGVWQALAALDVQLGPWLPAIGGVTLTPAAATGTGVAVVASSSVFKPGHVGALVRFIENAGAPPVKRWVSEEAFGAGAFCFNGGRVYQTTAGGTTGNNSPIHDEGTVSDGGVAWTFIHDGAGVAKIASVIDDTNATIDVQVRLPSTAATPYWYFGAFSNDAGFTSVGTIHQERMALGGADLTPDSLYLTRTGGYGPDHADFKPGLGSGLVVDSDAVTRTLASDTVQKLRHLLSFERLYVFTDEAVHVVSGPSVDEPITPSQASARERNGYGAAWEVPPLKAGDAILYVTSGRQEIREIIRDTLDTPNATIIADHIGERGFAEMCFVKSPRPVLFARMDDGGLASMTYERLEQVRAWARQAIGGDAQVESIAAFPKPDGKREVWMIVKRVIDGADRFSIEKLPAAWNQRREALEKACALDAAGYFDFWNTNANNRARLHIVNHAARACEVETELDSFSGGDVGKTLALRLKEPRAGLDAGAEATICRVEVLALVNAKKITGRIVSDGPAALADAWTMLWAKMARVLQVGARLEACAVDVLGDGGAQTGLTVLDGAVTLREPCARGWVGLPFVFEIIDMPVAQGAPNGTSMAARKHVEKVWAVCAYATPGGEVFNPDTGAADPLFWRAAADPSDRPAAPVTGYHAIAPRGGWNDHGQIGLRHAAPFPFMLLGLIKEVSS